MLKVVDHYFIFNGKSSLDFNAKIDGNATFGSPERDVERFEIPGRNGTLTIDNGRFMSKQVTYTGFIARDFENNSDALRNWLMQDGAVHRLEDSIHPDEFRMASFSGPFDPSVMFLEAGTFSVNFYCQPERWLKSGENKITVTSAAQAKVYNPSPFTAKPLIIVTAGTGAINIGSEIITLTANNGATYIDCETQDAWEGSINRNGNIERTTGGFPELPTGETEISVGSGMTIQIQPRWWKV